MAFEYPTPTGVVRLIRKKQGWSIQFQGRRSSAQWFSPDAAATAVARHQSGLSEWDGQRSEDASDDLLDWRPLAESL
jgi:hypothetical protein